MACSKDNSLDSQCNLAVDVNTVFTESKGFDTNIPVLPDPDPYPRGLKYTIKANIGYTRELNLEEFLNSAKANQIDERITDPKMKSNWKKNLKAYYEITSGTAFDLDITLLNEKQEVFDDNTTSAQIDFYPNITRP